MWSSPISYEAKDFAIIVRESLEKLNFVFMRDNTTKSYSRFVVILPMMGAAHVYRYTVEYPSSFVIQIYDTYPSSKPGLIPFMDIEPLDESNKKDMKRLLDEVLSRVNRPPWEFSRGQRFMVGYLLPEFMRARKAWAELGYDTSKKTSRKIKKEEKAKRGRINKRKQKERSGKEGRRENNGQLTEKEE